MDEFEIDREALLQTFLAEAEETFVHMEQSLVLLESRPGDDALLHALFRDAHTLKGAAGLVGFDGVRDLAHDLEDVLERLRKRTLAVNDTVVTLLLRSVDLLRGAVRDAAGGSTAPSEAVIAFRRRLADAAGSSGTGPERGAAPGAPQGAEPGESLSSEILAFCADKLARYKTPRSIDYTREMPRDPNGKLYKRKLRDPYWEGRDRAI